jgi:hypothetical protein
MNINPNDPAFPIVDANEKSSIAPGLPIRAQLAAMAMQGILANSPDWDGKDTSINWISVHSVKYADALIAELNK